MLYLELFWCFFQIGLLSFGGGYAALPLIQSHVVEQNGWLTMQAFGDLLAISQMTPGPIALNAATFVGTMVGGPLGAVVATLGCITPSCIIVLTLAYLYKRFKKLDVIQGALAGLRPTVVALTFSAGLSIVMLALWGAGGWKAGILNIDLIALALFGGGIVLMRKVKMNAIYVILGCGIIGGGLYLLLGPT